MPTETYSLGESVEIKNIGRELKKLWQESEGAMTRASLINLAVYSEKPGLLEKNTQLMARITEDHACRALLIGANRNSKETGSRHGSTRIATSAVQAANKSVPSRFPFCLKDHA